MMRPEIASRVSAFADQLRQSALWPRIVAVVVTGSAARGEEVWAGDTLCSDIDVMVVTKSESLRLSTAIDRMIREHRAQGIDGGRIPTRSLRRYGTLFFYEARHGGAVVAGDSTVLDLVQMEHPTQIPVWEAFRVLANRALEVVKAQRGVVPVETAVRKCYEALGDAVLVLEGRYRPSFRGRLDEITRQPLDLFVDDLDDIVRTVLERRLAGSALSVGRTIEQARHDLVAGLTVCLGRHLGRSGTADELLAVLARSEFHLGHRVYWSARELRARRVPSALRVDPIVTVWSRALHCLQTGSDDPRLLEDWVRCPQILKPPALDMGRPC
jgi:hypothetical protein